MRRFATIPLPWILALAAGLTGCAQNPGEQAEKAGPSAAEASPIAADGYYDIGGFHQEVTTTSPPAQVWFDRGLAMAFAFNHEEAVRCFEQAQKEDPTMVMAPWGMAYAWGPNINNMDIEAGQIARAAAVLAAIDLQAQPATPLERGLVQALATRYAVPVPEDRQPLNKAYADAMRRLYQEHQDDPLVAALFAESLMILRPWNQWTPEGQPAPETPEIMAVLERALAAFPDYPALNHLYIHTMEASSAPAKALSAANRLRGAMPGAGHLVHMPSHIDILVGDYERAIAANQQAIEVDKEFLKRQGPENFYSLYRLHNYHFLVYGAMFAGRYALAMAAARDIASQVPEEMLKEQADYLDAFMPTPLHVMVRFGRWQDILTEPEPAAYLPVSRSVWRYARGIAYAALGRVEEAEAEQRAFRDMRSRIPASSILFNNSSMDILGVADAMLAGEIDYRKGAYDLAFEDLRGAVRLDDALNYDEPWGWMQPARHALGALLVEQKRFAEAEDVYRRDLKRHPKNVWALNGLAECLEQQGKADEALQVRARFEQAAARSDVTIDRSCYCRNMDQPRGE